MLTCFPLQSTNGMLLFFCFCRQFLDSDMPRYIILPLSSCSSVTHTSLSRPPHAAIQPPMKSLLSLLLCHHCQHFIRASLPSPLLRSEGVLVHVPSCCWVCVCVCVSCYQVYDRQGLHGWFCFPLAVWWCSVSHSLLPRQQMLGTIQ